MRFPVATSARPIRFAVASSVLLLLATGAQAATDGTALFASNCASCHQADGSGQADQFPPLRNRVDKIAASPEGKRYLADVLTHGLNGPIDVGGDSYAGFMPSFARLPDEQIAAILTTVSAMGDTKPAPVFTASDIAAARSHNLTAAAVNVERTSLDGVHKLP